MTINKNLYADVQDGQTNGGQAAALVNDNKRAVNDVIDVLNGNLPEFPQQAGDLDISTRSGQLILSRKAPDGTVVELNGGDIEELRNWNPKTLAEWLNTKYDLGLVSDPSDQPLKLRRGTTAEHAVFTGANCEVTVDTEKKTLVVHDGDTPGGNPLVDTASLAEPGSTVMVGGAEASNISAQFTIDSCAEGFATIPVGWIKNGAIYEVKGYFPGSDIGGGLFYYDSTKPKSDHNGVTVFSRTVPRLSLQIGGDEADKLTNYHTGLNETDPSGSGCFVRFKTDTIIAEWAGAKPDTYSQRVAINAAILVAFNEKCRYVKMGQPFKVYNVDVGPQSIRIRSGVILDLNNSIIQRIGTNIDRRVIENFNYGKSVSTVVDSDFGVINGTIVGTGGTNGVSDQGACIFWFDADQPIIENIKTQSSNGDGIGWRRTSGAIVRNVQVGNYGRNGWSPTSGTSCRVDNLQIVGDPYPGANPGLAIDAENDSATEKSSGVWTRVKAKNVTFVDFWTETNGRFAHDFMLSDCDFGPSFRAFRVVSENPTSVGRFVLSESCTIRVGAGGASSTGVQVENVSGFTCDAKFVLEDSTGSNYGIEAKKTVNRLLCSNVIMPSGLTQGLQAYESTDILSDSVFRGCNLRDIYLTGSNNLFENGSASSVQISQSGSIDNIFGPTFKLTSVSSVNGADLRRQQIATQRGIGYPSFFSQEVLVADGTSPKDITIPIPEGNNSSGGRGATIICNYSHRGDSGHWAHAIFTTRHGLNGNGLTATIANNQSASINGFSFISATSSSVTIRLEFTFSGTASFTVLC